MEDYDSTFCGVPSVPCISVNFYRWVARLGREGQVGHLVIGIQMACSGGTLGTGGTLAPSHRLSIYGLPPRNLLQVGCSGGTLWDE